MTTSKNAKVLNWLLSGRPLTSLDAIYMFGHTRLAAYINKLRKAGYTIETRLIPSDGSHYAEYTLKRNQDVKA